MPKKETWIAPDGNFEQARPATDVELADGVAEPDPMYHQHEYGSMAFRHCHQGALASHEHAMEVVEAQVKAGRATIHEIGSE